MRRARSQGGGFYSTAERFKRLTVVVLKSAEVACRRTKILLKALWKLFWKLQLFVAFDAHVRMEQGGNSVDYLPVVSTDETRTLMGLVTMRGLAECGM